MKLPNVTRRDIQHWSRWGILLVVFTATATVPVSAQPTPATRTYSAILKVTKGVVQLPESVETIDLREVQLVESGEAEVTVGVEHVSLSAGSRKQMRYTAQISTSLQRTMRDNNAIKLQRIPHAAIPGRGENRWMRDLYFSVHFADSSDLAQFIKQASSLPGVVSVKNGDMNVTLDGSSGTISPPDDPR